MLQISRHFETIDDDLTVKLKVDGAIDFGGSTNHADPVLPCARLPELTLNTGSRTIETRPVRDGNRLSCRLSIAE